MEGNLGESLSKRLAERMDGRRMRSGSRGRSAGRAAAALLVLLVLVFNVAKRDTPCIVQWAVDCTYCTHTVYNTYYWVCTVQSVPKSIL